MKDNNEIKNNLNKLIILINNEIKKANNNIQQNNIVINNLNNSVSIEIDNVIKFEIKQKEYDDIIDDEEKRKVIAEQTIIELKNQMNSIPNVNLNKEQTKRYNEQIERLNNEIKMQMNIISNRNSQINYYKLQKKMLRFDDRQIIFITMKITKIKNLKLDLNMFIDRLNTVVNKIKLNDEFDDSLYTEEEITNELKETYKSYGKTYPG